MTTLTKEDIARITPLIRAMYYGQEVLMHNTWDYALTLTGQLINCDYRKYLILRPLSSITDDEAIQVAKIAGFGYNDLMAGKEVMKCIEEGIVIYSVPYLIINNIFQFLIQSGFALPFYDTTLNRTIPVSELVENKIIQLTK